MKQSKTILILFFIFYLFDSFTGGEITKLLSLDIEKISYSNEYWRLFSYPLASGSFESMLLLIFALGIFAPKIESKLKSFLLPLIIFLVSLMHGTLFAWIYMYENVVFAGSEGISFFILLSFIFTDHNARFKFFGSRSISAGSVIILAITLWALAKILLYLDYNVIESYYSLLFAGFGTANAFIVLAQILIINKFGSKEKSIENSSQREFQDYEKELSQIEKDELSLALIASQNKRYKEKQKDETLKLSPDPKVNEDKMNRILDKISDHGYPSLSQGEQKFLKEYSKIIK